ncbi:MAG: cation-transporting P-type ATPase [Actinobacteria bacterium]|nr:cation-transporting P-type ATPase [Actinomycetota bacterium]
MRAGTDLHQPIPDPSAGLTPEEAASRLAEHGANELPPPRRERLPARLLRHLGEPMSLLLIAAAAVSWLGLGERIDAMAILAIVVLNVAIGLVQEGRAARALEALRAMESPTARVRRGGHLAVVPARALVPGDLVLLAAGDRVPADLEVSDADTLEVDESLETGESLPVAKAARGRPGDDGERASVLLSGTLVTRGRAEGLVTATGPGTELGLIAGALAERQPPTPLQLELRRLTGRLGTVAVGVAVGVFGLTLMRTAASEGALERSFLAAVALAVAAVPEGLATVVSVALALGVRRMARSGAIIRRLPAVETLGSTTALLSDKTGTLTENRMHLETVTVGLGDPLPPGAVEPEALDRIAEVAVLCNDASLDPRSGDPLDLALLDALGRRLPEMQGRHPRTAGLPFDSARRRMTTLHEHPAGRRLLVKGAPEAVLERCATVVDGPGAERPLSPEDRARVLGIAAGLAARGMRLLALAAATLPEAPADLEAAEDGLALVGMVGLRDPVRPEAPGAVSDFRRAGIHLLMVTGDHPGTAAAIAEEVGLLAPGDPVLTGVALRDHGLPEDPLTVTVYARVDPGEKLALVETLRDRGHVVAVTGDGVNDAPALRRADIGVAMGRGGSDVAREAADMVITDDNLATIATAVREGRGIYDNIRKVVNYLVAGNLSEIAVVVVALLLFPALGIPLLPLQLLWINLLTDGLPALALGVDPADPGLLSRPPRRPSDRLLSLRRLGVLSVRGLLIAGASLGALVVARFAWNEPWTHARGVMFTVLVVAHLLYAFAARLPSRAFLENRALLAAVGMGVLLQLVAVSWGPAQALLGTAPLSPREWALVAVGGVAPVAVMLALGRPAVSPGPRPGGPVPSP